MGIVNKYERLEALRRQESLHKYRCKKCPYRKDYNFSEECFNCPVRDELLEIGKVLDGTVRERVIWDYDKKGAS